MHQTRETSEEDQREVTRARRKRRGEEAFNPIQATGKSFFGMSLLLLVASMYTHAWWTPVHEASEVISRDGKLYYDLECLWHFVLSCFDVLFTSGAAMQHIPPIVITEFTLIRHLPCIPCMSSVWVSCDFYRIYIYMNGHGLLCILYSCHWLSQQCCI